MQPGLVSVMMPVYNAEQYVEQAIESVLAQTYSNWELVIVNDGSTDRTAEIFGQFNDLRIRVIHQPNRGEAAARNTALTHLQGEFVAFLDADDAFLPDHLEITAHSLLVHPDQDGVYTDGYYCDREMNLLQTLSSRRRGPFEGRIFEQVVRGSDALCPPVSVVLRHNVIVQNQLVFDEDIVIGADWAFFTEFSDAGVFGYVDQHTCLYRIHLSNVTVQTGFHKQALHLAKCRAKAIRINSFGECSVETRFAVFHDLMVNLLRGFPDRQSEITQWPEFQELPPDIQAKLLRLLAARALARGGQQGYISDWLRRSRELNPRDWRGALLSILGRVSPSLCGLLLRARNIGQTDPLAVPPYADIKRYHHA